MKKTIHIIPTFELGGVQTGILYSLENINKTIDFSVLVIFGNDKKLTKNLPKYIQNKIIWTESNHLIIGWIKAFFLLLKNKPDLIISSLWKSAPLSIAYRLFNPKTKLFAFYHSTKLSHWLDKFLLKSISMCQDNGIADSFATKSFIENKFSKKNLSVVPYIFSFEKNQKHSRKMISADNINLAYFGRIKEEKGVGRCIAFCSLCKKNNINVNLSIYGEGDIAFFQKLAEHLDVEENIHFLNTIPLESVSSAMINFDFLIQLSNFEGMALSVVEAMNVGLVPIVTPVGEIASYSKDGENAIWLEGNFDSNLNELVSKVKKVVDNPNLYEQLSINASNIFKNSKKYNEAMIEAIESLQ